MRTRPENRTPDWSNMTRVLECRVPSRPTLFELFLNDRLIREVSGIVPKTTREYIAATIRANDLLGYDYTLQLGSDFHYPFGAAQHKETVSLNDTPSITDRASFDAYPWPDPSECDYSYADIAGDYLPDGMKLMIWSSDGLLETVTRLLGYENLCLLLYDDEALVSDVFERVGAGYLEYFRRCVERPGIMALVSSDDWGFNTQTLLPPDALRKYVFPWQREYVNLAHKHGKYAILHSCGVFEDILEDILCIGFDARHSYEDGITPVEQAYEKLSGSIAVLGGMDVDFLVRSDTEQIRKRSTEMLARAASRGGYALGSGNSIANYIPDEHYLAMISCAWQ